MDDVMLGRDGPENLGILKKSQLKVDIVLCWKTVEFSAIGVYRIEFSAMESSS